MEPDVDTNNVQGVKEKCSELDGNTHTSCVSGQPITNDEVTDGKGDSIEDGGHGLEDTEVMKDHGCVVPADDIITKKKKKKRSKKSASKKGIKKPTGMEQFYADPPLTLDQYNEQRELYDPELGFADRIMTAIQRFERTRRLTSERKDVFYKWLQYGGFESGPNMFVGKIDSENMDKDQLAAAMSQVRITNEAEMSLDEGESGPKSYVVGFLGCMKGFLSYRAFNVWSFDTKEEVQLVTTTLERFMDYLLQHDVCPEYMSDVLETRGLCRDASAEIWACSQAQRWLPGDFNMACSTLFQGEYGRNYDGETYWGPDNQEKSVFVGLTAEKATQIVGFAIAGAADEHIYQKYIQLTQGDSKQDLDVIKKIEGHGFEITNIQNPTADCKQLYMTRSENFRPVGRVLGKPWFNPEAAPEDLTEEETKTLALIRQKSSQEQYLFFIEEIILRHLSVGQKIQATVWETNCGVWFFDDFVRILPSFETYLVNEMMVGYKEPRSLEDDTADRAEDEVEVEMENDANETPDEANNTTTKDTEAFE